ncbi:MAG: hypothetical protein AB2385_04570 [Symbiobacterium sp.]|uniref:hypothetical protein n=1 Tax=Symbiobacterium sp. TaxID=1971213 RepID=UPI0034649B95
MTDGLQQAVSAAFRALEEAEPLSGAQVRAQLCLSHLAAAAGRRVEALAFALAARTTAREAALPELERSATALLAACVDAGGWNALSELAGALREQGVDVYDYLDPAEVLRLAEE